MQRLQIYTQTELGPSIEFRITCHQCKYFQVKEHLDEEEYWQELKCLKMNRVLENGTTPFDCPLINIEKANSILNAIENYVKV